MPGRLVLNLCVLVLCALPAVAQSPALLPPRPVPVAPGPVPFTPPTPLEYTPPPPQPPPSFGPTSDPGPNGWAPYEPPSQAPGLFFDAQIALVYPVIKNRLTNDSAPVPAMFSVPGVELGTTVSPTFELGYRLPECGGYFAVAYRFLVDEANGTSQVNGVALPTRTRLNLNVVDLDYGTMPYEPVPRWLLSYRLGARIADVYFDNQITKGNLQQTASNSYIGSGAHGRFDFERRIVPVPGLALFGRIDGSVLIGQVQQRFREDTTQPNGSVLSSTTTVRRSQAVPVLNLQAGLSYIPPGMPNLKFTTGYEYEHWFSVGRIGLQPDQSVSESTADVWWQGLFLRAQVDF